MSGIWTWAREQAPETPPGGAAPAATQQGGRQGGGRGGGAPRVRPRKVVLAWADTRNGQAQHDSTSHALSVIEQLGYESGAYDTYIRTDSNIIAIAPLMTTGARASGGPSLAAVDAIFFMGHREVALDPKQREELATFVREGKGLVAAHVGLTAFESWPEWGTLIGARYDGHPWGGTNTGTVINEDPTFPATRHFPATFPFRDEFYQAKDGGRDKFRVLLRLDVNSMPPHENLRNRDYPIAWAKTYGKGRVFYSSLGHATETWDNRDVRLMYYEAVKWALGLTDGDATPRPAPGGTAAR
jgi:uncharacterized protein